VTRFLPTLTLRRFGSIAAGFPSPAQGYEDEPLDLNDLLIRHPAATFFFRARGDRYRADGILDGSILVVDRSVKPAPGGSSSPTGTASAPSAACRLSSTAARSCRSGAPSPGSSRGSSHVRPGGRQQLLRLGRAGLRPRRRPVVVLSNNDGVVVAASKDAKALGLEMFRPFFQIRHLLRGHHVKVFSSNYTLYDDMSRRLVDIYRTHAETVEVYSIDECFLTLGGLNARRLMHWGRELRRQAQQWTGIPVGVGIGPSKTLAKLANHMAKRDPAPGSPEGVCVLASKYAADVALGRVELKDLWGVAGGTIRRIAKLGITTPRQLRDAR
jgi:hypothetical protein